MQAAGKKLFMCTNSQWDYTHVLMNFLLCGAHLQGPLRPSPPLSHASMVPSHTIVASCCHT